MQGVVFAIQTNVKKKLEFMLHGVMQLNRKHVRPFTMGDLEMLNIQRTSVTI